MTSPRKILRSLSLLSLAILVEVFVFPASAQTIRMEHRHAPLWSRQSLRWQCAGADVRVEVYRTFRLETGLKLAFSSISIDGEGVREQVSDRLNALFDKGDLTLLPSCLGDQPIIVVGYAEQVRETAASDTYEATLKEEFIPLRERVAPTVQPDRH